MQPTKFEEVLAKIVEEEPRYRREAYFFLREALDHAQRIISKANKNQVRHVTGQELLEGIRQYGLSQFGPMAKTLLNEWGVHRCEDFGELVFILVEKGLLSKTDTDSREDFKGGYGFNEAFCEPYLPESKKRASQPAVEETRPAAS